MSELAKPGEAYVTATGDVVEPIEEQLLDNSTPVMGVPQIDRMHISNRKSLSDLPASPQIQKVINVVLVHVLLGLTDIEIAHTLKVSHTDILNVKLDPAFQQTFELIYNELIDGSAASIKGQLAAHSVEALNKVVSLVSEGDKDIVKLKAAQDIMDRAGLQPANIKDAAQNNQAEGLHIVIQEAKDQTDIRINIRGEEIG